VGARTTISPHRLSQRPLNVATGVEKPHRVHPASAKIEHAGGVHPRREDKIVARGAEHGIRYGVMMPILSRSWYLPLGLWGSIACGNSAGNASGTSTGGTSSTGGITSTSGGGTVSATGGSTGSGGSTATGSTITKLVSTAVFYQDISKAAVDSESATILGALQTSGWGDTGKRTTLGIDFSFEVNVADPSVPRRAFTEPADALPDCDTAPIPLPPGGKTEGTSDYSCSDGDCHLLVFQDTRLYELYQSNVTTGMATGGDFTGTCLVVWDLTRDYWQPTPPPNFSRGDGCNGADAGDMPIAPLLLTKEELAAGVVQHAMRFTISNNRIRSAVYVHPATHIGGPSGGADTLPYGSRLRLRADYDLSSLPNDADRAIAKALQTYGMFLADGGNIYISATTEASDTVGGSDLGKLTPSDFDMIDGGQRIDWESQNCTRTPVSD
jgi:serine/threonine-protein kinase